MKNIIATGISLMVLFGLTTTSTLAGDCCKEKASKADCCGESEGGKTEKSEAKDGKEIAKKPDGKTAAPETKTEEAGSKKEEK